MIHLGENILQVHCQNGNDIFFNIITPVEQIYFVVIVCPKKSEEPPREIGFHVGRQEI
jgi:hypothetical protein